MLACACALVALALPSSAHAYTWGPAFEQTGPQQTMFDWSAARCQSDNIPDSAAHAIRDGRGRIQVLVTHHVNYRLIGRDFNSLVLQCHQHLVSTDSGNPATFNNREWIAVPYTKDGRTIYALGSNEYQGNRFVGFCDSGNYFKCLYLSVIGAMSRDFGDNYTQPSLPMVTTSPYQYFKETGPSGSFAPSNIVKRHDSYYYSLYKVNPYLAQPGGVCLMRTRNLRDLGSWKSWDGTSFSIPRHNPYVVVPRERAENYVCHLVDPVSIGGMSQSLTWNSYLHKYLLVGNEGKYVAERGGNVYGFWYSTSTDLIHWSDREILVEVPTPTDWVCGEEFPWSFPSVIDHNSRSRSFTTSDRDFYLYYTLSNRPGCTSGLDRDMVRVPIRFK